MNFYKNIDEVWRLLLLDLLYQTPIDSRAGRVKEITAYSFKLCDINQTFLLNKRRKLSPHYACAETLWYLQPTKSIEMIKAYAPQYEKFADGNGKAWGAYGYRFFHEINQFKLTIDLLKQNPETRQAILSIWNKQDLVEQDKHNDIPCTISLQFLLRNGKLNLIVTMRSNDAWLGLPYDVFAFTCLQRLVAHGVGVEPGWYVHQVGSEHLYEKHWKAAEEAVSTPINISYQRLEHEWATDEYKIDDLGFYIEQALSCEMIDRMLPSKRIPSSFPEKFFISDLVACCGIKWGHPKKLVHSPILKEALKNVNH